MERCAHCQSPLAPGERFCPRCGKSQPLGILEAQTFPGSAGIGVRSCPRCRAMQPEAALFCGDCGYSFSQPLRPVSGQPMPPGFLGPEAAGAIWGSGALRTQPRPDSIAPGAPGGPQSGAVGVPYAPGAPQSGGVGVPGAPAWPQSGGWRVPATPANPQSGAVGVPGAPVGPQSGAPMAPYTPASPQSGAMGVPHAPALPQSGGVGVPGAPAIPQSGVPGVPGVPAGAQSGMLTGHASTAANTIGKRLGRFVRQKLLGTLQAQIITAVVAVAVVGTTGGAVYVASTHGQSSASNSLPGVSFIGPSNSASFTLAVDIKTVDGLGHAKEFQETLLVKNGTACQARDDGKRHTLTNGYIQVIAGLGTPYQEKLTGRCQGTYRNGKLSYTETASYLENDFPLGVICTAHTPLVLQQLTGTFTSATRISGNFSAAPSTYDCSLGTTASFPKKDGSWSGNAR